MALNIEGALRNMKPRELDGLFKFDDGRPMTAIQAKAQLKIEAMKGRKVLPCGPCDNFDYQTGCKGHDD